MTDDEEHLRLLSIFHFILGGLSALAFCIPLIHLTLGIALVTGIIPSGQKGEEVPQQVVGWFFIGCASLAIVLGWSYSISMVIAGRRLRQHRTYTFCITMAALSCASVPFGTCLGVFTILVLARPSVKQLFEKQKAVLGIHEL